MRLKKFVSLFLVALVIYMGLCLGATIRYHRTEIIAVTKHCFTGFTGRKDFALGHLQKGQLISCIQNVQAGEVEIYLETDDGQSIKADFNPFEPGKLLIVPADGLYQLIVIANCADFDLTFQIRAEPLFRSGWRFS